MTDGNQAGSAGDANAGGEGKKDVVSYETHRRLLDQHKKTQAQLDEYAKRIEQIEADKRLTDEQKLAEQGEFKKLVQLREEKLAELTGKLSEYEQKLSARETEMINLKKLSYVNNKLPAKLLKTEYYDRIPLSEIVYNPETGEIDEESVNVVANKFSKEYPELFDKKSVNIPNGAPNGTGGITYEAWKKLSYKKKAEMLNHVID